MTSIVLELVTSELLLAHHITLHYHSAVATMTAALAICWLIIHLYLYMTRVHNINYNLLTLAVAMIIRITEEDFIGLTEST